MVKYCYTNRQCPLKLQRKKINIFIQEFNTNSCPSFDLLCITVSKKEISIILMLGIQRLVVTGFSPVFDLGWAGPGNIVKRRRDSGYVTVRLLHKRFRFACCSYPVAAVSGNKLNIGPFNIHSPSNNNVYSHTESISKTTKQNSKYTSVSRLGRHVYTCPTPLI